MTQIKRTYLLMALIISFPSWGFIPCNENNIKKGNIILKIQDEINQKMNQDPKGFVAGKYDSSLCPDFIKSGKYERSLKPTSIDCRKWSDMFGNDDKHQRSIQKIFNFDSSDDPHLVCDYIVENFLNSLLKEKIQNIRDHYNSNNKTEMNLEMISSDDSDSKRKLQRTKTPGNYMQPQSLPNPTYIPNPPAGSGALRQ